MSTKTEDMSGGASFTLLVLLLPACLWQGYVLATLWGWFVVPLGVPAIGTWQAAGLVTAVDLLRLKVPEERTRDWADYIGRWLLIFTTGPLLMLGIGWVFHWVGGPR